MATYFHGNSEIQGGGDGLQTLILMNPAYVGYSDSQPQQPPASSNFVFLNSSSAGNGMSIPHAPPPQAPHFVGIPLQGAISTASAEDPSDVSALHGFLPRVQYNLYNQQGSIDLAAAREVARPHQGLSLSLSSQQPGYGHSQQLMAAVSHSQPRETDVRISGGSPSPASGVSNGVNGVQSVLLSSKYLKAAQELLDEVVKVGKGGKNAAEVPSAVAQPKKTGESSTTAAAAVGGGCDGETEREGSEKRGAAELSTAERQQIQMKKAKLVNMLDEVEQRYRQYHHQMQIVISWFEQVAGIGAAKTYTALALQTISKQFRCLKDAILGQIQAASKSLGQEDGLVGKTEGSRLKYVDNQIRQQRALQQLGMIQHNAWRPQRGLPERSVSVLRAWLFEHFLHPYPKDSDKIMLAKQTGLTRSQVSNWFINARVRLWKPMVEEMYMEEVKEHEKNGSEDKSPKTDQQEDSTSKSAPPSSKNTPILNQATNFTSKQDSHISHANNTAPSSISNHAGFHLIEPSDHMAGGIIQSSPKKPRNADMLHSLVRNIPSINMDSKPTPAENDQNMPMKFDRQSCRDGFTLMGAVPANYLGGFGSYQMHGELVGEEQFQPPYSGNGVSLTLGLPHCENHQNFLPNQAMQQLGRGLGMNHANEFSSMNTASTSSHSTIVYENINIQNPRGSMHSCCPTL